MHIILNDDMLSVIVKARVVWPIEMDYKANNNCFRGQYQKILTRSCQYETELAKFYTEALRVNIIGITPKERVII